MAAVTNTFISSSAVGNREDLTNAIYNISPFDTPFISMIGRVDVEGVTHEWQTDSLAADRQVLLFQQFMVCLLIYSYIRALAIKAICLPLMCHTFNIHSSDHRYEGCVKWRYIVYRVCQVFPVTYRR